VTFVTDLPDPQTDCDPSGPKDVDSSFDAVEDFPGPHYSSWCEQVVLRSKAYSIETMFGGARGQACGPEVALFDSETDHGGWRCPCPNDLSYRVAEVIARDGAFIWRDESTATCAGHTRIHGGWRLGCGAKIHWPSDWCRRCMEKMDDAALSVAKNI
jgi:hypothetical protein